MLLIPAFAPCLVIVVLLMVAAVVAPVSGAIAYAISSIIAKIFNKEPQHISKSVASITAVMMFIVVFCGLSLYIFGQSPPPVPDEFKESDLIGTWQAIYGSPNTKDTLKLKSDGTYQQVFQLPAGDYYYEGKWNNWYLEYTSDGRPKLHLEGMSYCISSISMCEQTWENETASYSDPVDEKSVLLTNELILRVVGDENSPRGIQLLHMLYDPDDSPESFVFIGE